MQDRLLGLLGLKQPKQPEHQNNKLQLWRDQLNKLIAEGRRELRLRVTISEMQHQIDFLRSCWLDTAPLGQLAP